MAVAAESERAHLGGQEKCSAANVSAGLPLISVVTPSFNQGAFIERCIRSVADQNYANFEHIVFDNRSTDETLDVLRRYPHVRWTSERDTGQSDALNKAIGQARGEIIAWINADDFYHPGAFALAARELARDTGVKAIAGGVDFVDAEGRTRETFQPIYTGRDHLIEFWDDGYGLAQPGVLFRREVIDEIGGLREELHYAMDYDFWLRLTQHYPIKIVAQTLSGFALHADSKTVSLGHGSRFIEESVRISRQHWGPRSSKTYRRRERAYRRFAAEHYLCGLFHAHKRERALDWKALGAIVRYRPARLLDRHVFALFAERLVGRRGWQAVRRCLPRGSR